MSKEVVFEKGLEFFKLKKEVPKHFMGKSEILIFYEKDQLDNLSDFFYDVSNQIKIQLFDTINQKSGSIQVNCSESISHLFEKVSREVYGEKISPDHIVLRAAAKRNENSFKFMNLYNKEKRIDDLIEKHGLIFEATYSNLSSLRRESVFEFEMAFLDLDGNLDHIDTIEFPVDTTEHELTPKLVARNELMPYMRKQERQLKNLSQKVAEINFEIM